MEKEIFNKLKELLIPVLVKNSLMGSNSDAIIYQWGNAIMFNYDPFGKIKKEIILNQILEAVTYNNIHSSHFTFIDLFAGIGGIRLAFENVGGTCVFSSEFDKFAQRTYVSNFEELPFGDITKINPYDIPNHDILCAGFPCQPFSQAGKRLGLDDTRGTLFHNIAQILQTKQPKMALLENVKGLIWHNKGKTLQTILQVIGDMGYLCNIEKSIIDGMDLKLLQKEAKKMVLNTKDFGIPQNRERIFLVFWKSTLPITKFIYPIPTYTPTKVSDILEQTPLEKYTLSTESWNGHLRRKENHIKNKSTFGYKMVYPQDTYTRTITARYYKDGSEALLYQGEDKNPRRLTPREIARLQGYPETFILYPTDTQAYKQLGNSVTVPVVELIAKNMWEVIKWID